VLPAPRRKSDVTGVTDVTSNLEKNHAHDGTVLVPASAPVAARLVPGRRVYRSGRRSCRRWACPWRQPASADPGYWPPRPWKRISYILSPSWWSQISIHVCV